MIWQTWTRPALAACALTLTLGSPVPAAASEEPTTQADYGAVETIIRERAAAHGVSGARMVAVATCESRLDVNAVGDGGRSVGLFQIFEDGLYPLFLRQGYTDRRDAWQSSDFAARAFAAGLSSHWTCAR